MKGLVFTEFFELVDKEFSMETSEQLIEMSDLPSGAIYTSVGTYDPKEMVTLVTNLAKLTGISVPDLLRTFGRHLWQFFLVSYPMLFEGMSSSMEFLPRVNDYVHMEVQKLYPDAELPTFESEMVKEGQLIITYRSVRNLPDLAEGLIRQCIEHFGESMKIKRETIPGETPATRFTITAV